MKTARFCLKSIYGNSNSPDDNKNNVGNINMENKEDGLDDENSFTGTECCLSKIEKLVVPARVALLQIANMWVSDSGKSVHCMNNRCRGSNIHEGSGVGNRCTWRGYDC